MESMFRASRFNPNFIIQQRWRTRSCGINHFYLRNLKILNFLMKIMCADSRQNLKCSFYFDLFTQVRRFFFSELYVIFISRTDKVNLELDICVMAETAYFPLILLRNSTEQVYLHHQTILLWKILYLPSYG